VRRALVVSLVTLFAIGAFATVFDTVFRQLPKERTVFVHNPVDAEKAVSEGERLTIGLRPPEPSTVIVNEVNDESLTTSDGRTISYRDLFAITKGTLPSRHGYDWSVSYRSIGPQKVLSPGQTVTVLFKGPKPIVATITRKDADNFSTEDGQIVPYNEVSYVSRDIPLRERIDTTLNKMPTFLLWAVVDFASIFGSH
jgi:hypothetical protein